MLSDDVLPDDVLPETFLSRWPGCAGNNGSRVPRFVFDPADPWTLTFQAGLRRAGLGGKRIHEIGVGSGANVAFMLQCCAAAQVHGSDVDPRLPVLAQKFVAEVVPELADRFRPIHGSVNLFDLPADQAETASTDFIVGCLPQVPDPEDAMYGQFRQAQLGHTGHAGRRLENHLAHYYPWTAFHEYPFNAVGLGLIEALLRKTRARAPQAEVILNLGCRVGKGILLRLFRANGYQAQELISRIVRQDEDTDISFFVALESALRGMVHGSDFVCDFYTDQDGLCPISAREAMVGMAADPAMLIFHEICVLRGYPLATDSETGR